MRNFYSNVSVGAECFNGDNLKSLGPIICIYLSRISKWRLIEGGARKFLGIVVEPIVRILEFCRNITATEEGILAVVWKDLVKEAKISTSQSCIVVQNDRSDEIASRVGNCI